MRPAQPSDLPFLWAMLGEAASWRLGRPAFLLEDESADPVVRRYLDGWGRPGDFGLVAVTEEGEAVGGAWYRLYRREEAGYGFIDERTPELSIAVAPEARGRGVGTQLLVALIEHARDDGIDALSLSVEADNPALRLYERLGFVRVGGDPTLTMRLGL